MAVRNAVDYYNASGIQIGDIVIINDHDPQSCEGEQIAEPYTRLRVKTLEMEQYSKRGEIRAYLETEHDGIPLNHSVDLLNMRGEPLLYKAEDWFKTTTAAYRFALKKGRVFGRSDLNPGILFAVFLTLWVLALMGIIYWAAQPKICHQQISEAGYLVVAFITAAMIGTLLFGASAIERKADAIGNARKQTAELEEQLQLYRLANPNCAEVATSVDTD